jgi:hypothetical protein
MTSTSQVHIPDRVPGISAGALYQWVIVTRVWAVADVVICAVELSAMKNMPTAELVVLIAILAVFILLSMATALFQWRRIARETDAGYTTLWRKNQYLPQLDARTGQVIRAAGQPFRTKTEWRQQASR